MTNIYDLAIVGSGPTSMMAAVKLVDNGYTNIVILEKGKNRSNKKGESATEGLGGAGSFSDSKVNLTHKAGGSVYDLCGLTKYYEYIKEQDDIWLRFAPTKEQRKKYSLKENVHDRLFVPDKNAEKLRAKALANHMDLLTFPIRHLGTTNVFYICENIFKFLQSKGVTVLDESEVTLVEKNDNLFTVNYENHGNLLSLNANKVLIASGRSGSKIFINTMKDFGLPLLNGGVDIGVRVEAPNEIGSHLLSDGIYEPKFVYYSELTKTKTRSFCYSKDTEVYTKNGFKLFKDLNIEEDIFLSVNPETEELEWVEAQDKQIIPFKGKMINFKSKLVDFLVTPEHKMYISRCHELEKKGQRIYGIYKNHFVSINEIRKRSDSFTILSKWKGFDGEVIFGNLKFSPEDFAFFMGWYISRGFLTKIKDKPNKDYLKIPQLNTVKKQILIDLLKRMGLNYVISRNSIYVLIEDEFKNIFGDLSKKFIPNEVKELDSKYLEVFINSYFNNNKNSKRLNNIFGVASLNEKVITTTSKQILDDLCEIILKTGFRPLINTKRGKQIKNENGEFVKENIYEIKVQKMSRAHFKRIEKSEVEYDDFVYDVTLKKNHTLLIRRNGKIWWGSNCYCPDGAVALEEYRSTGIKTVNGHSLGDGKKTGNLNFSVLATETFTEPFHQPQAYAESVCRLANLLAGGDVLVQRLGDLRSGRRSTPVRIRDGATIPTLDATPGDLSLCIPQRQLTAIIEFLEKMDKVMPGIASDHTLLYGMEVKFYSNRVEVNSASMTAINGLYVGGDGAGITRGLNQASVNGLIIADDLLEN